MMDALSKPLFNLIYNNTVSTLRNGTLPNHHSFEFWRNLVTGKNSAPSILKMGYFINSTMETAYYYRHGVIIWRC